MLLSGIPICRPWTSFLQKTMDSNGGEMLACQHNTREEADDYAMLLGYISRKEKGSK